MKEVLVNSDGSVLGGAIAKIRKSCACDGLFCQGMGLTNNAKVESVHHRCAYVCPQISNRRFIWDGNLSGGEFVRCGHCLIME